MGTFAEQSKNDPGYLDIAANGHGEEKSFLTAEALRRINDPNAHIIEIGPGGGAAVNSLVDQVPAGANYTLSLVEVESVRSASLSRARRRFRSSLGTTALHTADARHLAAHFAPASADVVAGSAVLHEVYSYGHGYQGLRDTMASIAQVLKPGGYFAYRDLFAVESLSLHDTVIQSYGRQGWLRFIQGFTPYYLENATHPYHRYEDELVFRQDSHSVRIEDLVTKGDAVVSGPIGLFREIQRHYITFRDHVWRSGALGFRPELDGRRAADWLDIKSGHKWVHYSLTDSDLLSSNQRQLLRGMSEEKDGFLVIDGDIFDTVSDCAIGDFFEALQRGDETLKAIWDEWLKREGSETYAYMTLAQLLGGMALTSLQANDAVMLPVSHEDVIPIPRAYYNRLLQRQLPNPLFDGKQLVLFKNVPLDDVEGIQRGLQVLQQHCSRETLSNLFACVNKKV